MFFYLVCVITSLNAGTYIRKYKEGTYHIVGIFRRAMCFFVKDRISSVLIPFFRILINHARFVFKKTYDQFSFLLVTERNIPDLYTILHVTLNDIHWSS